MAVLEGRPVLEDEAGLSSGNNVADDAEVRVGVDGSTVPLKCLGRNPSVTMPAKASSCSSSTVSFNSTLTEALVEILRSRSPALPFESMTRLAALMSRGMGVGSRLLLNGGRRRPAQSSMVLMTLPRLVSVSLQGRNGSRFRGVVRCSSHNEFAGGVGSLSVGVVIVTRMIGRSSKLRWVGNSESRLWICTLRSKVPSVQSKVQQGTENSHIG